MRKIDKSLYGFGIKENCISIEMKIDDSHIELIFPRKNNSEIINKVQAILISAYVNNSEQKQKNISH